MQSLSSVTQWRDILEASNAKPQLLFKHSTSCPVSAGAYDELSNWLEDAEASDFDCFLLRVIEDRDVSDAVAAALGVKHESPQLLYLANGEAKWHVSHWDITYSTLEAHLGKHCEK
ncbi:bacillithiol system redox-active protein YtxJ [Paenibacillus humicola]|uniref:bacillithiol system redox-active protein YtxJ n=1 Tax=Paenibacillus humicola TaxID=3110540 RepID=UPI00237ABC9C|nr:bacillithiol system redox-active protein YtxJ [Paenibacillus humicola]